MVHPDPSASRIFFDVSEGLTQAYQIMPDFKGRAWTGGEPRPVTGRIPQRFEGAAQRMPAPADCHTGLLNVSQASSRPVSKPRENQSLRCAEVPWLKLSGTT